MQPYGQQPSHYISSYDSPYSSQPAQQQQYGSMLDPVSSAGRSSSQPQQRAAAGDSVLSTTEFLARVESVRNDIRSLTGAIQQIASLHQQALASSDTTVATGPRAQLDQLVANTQVQNTSIRSQIQALKSDAERTTDGSFAIKKRQWESLNNEFKETIQKFLREEQQYKERYREQIARQYRIVNPEATEEEVQRAVDADWDDEGIFQQAVSSHSSLSLTLWRAFANIIPTATHQPPRPRQRGPRRRSRPAQRYGQDRAVDRGTP